MRAAFALAALGLLLLASGAASAERTQRVGVEVGYPLPGPVQAALYEDSACFSHEALWGAWFLAVAPAGKALGGSPTGAAAEADARAEHLENWLGYRGWQLSTGLFLNMGRPDRLAGWALGELDREDGCALTLAEFAAGLGPTAP